MQNTNDIFSIDQKVRQIIKSKGKDCFAVREELKNLEKQKKSLLESNTSSIRTRSKKKPTNISDKVLLDLDKRIKELQDIESQNVEIIFYEQETTPILDEYRNLLKIREPISFFHTPQSNESIKNTVRRNELVLEFNQIISRYTIEKFNFAVKESTVNNKYDMCSNCESRDLDDNDDYMITCRDCGAQHEAIPLTATYRDSQRLNTTATYEYDRKSHFKEVLSQYQGKQNAVVSPAVYSKLEELLDTYGLVDKKANNRLDRFRRVSRAHIKSFLKDMRIKKHYDDHIFIHSTITGQKAPDLSRWEDDIQDDHKMMLEVYNNLPDSVVGARKNFLNSRYVLQQLLLKRCIPFNKDDFVFLRSIDRMIAHNRVCEAIFKELDWKFTTIL